MSRTPVLLAMTGLALSAVACQPGSRYNPHGPEINHLGLPARGQAYTAASSTEVQSKANAPGAPSATAGKQ